MFRGLPEVKIQQKTAFWKVESLRNPVSKESAPEDAFISRYRDFERDHVVLGRFRCRAFGGQTESNRMDLGVFGLHRPSNRIGPTPKKSQ